MTNNIRIVFFRLSLICFILLQITLTSRVIAQSISNSTSTTEEYQDSVNAEYPGGVQALLDFIAQNTKYPASALENNIEGSVKLSFVVDTNGQVINVKVVEGVSPDLDSEAVRVISSLQTFQPATINGKKVSVQFNLPVNFKITENNEGIMMYLLKLLLGGLLVGAVGVLSRKYMKKSNY